MKESWYRANNQLFTRLKQEIEREYPDLRVIVEGGTVFARGSFSVKDGDDILDRFLIQLEFPRDFPDSIPILREIGGRIPWHQDRHTNTNGESCPIVPEEWLLRSDRDSILEFLAGPVRNFFLGQLAVEQGRHWPFGERPHGISGLLESYAELIGTSDSAAVRRYLDYLSRDIVKGHWDCPCGSNKRLRDCHLEAVKTLRQKIPPWVARSAFARLRKESSK
jgi:hypothetical protein